ncbi:MAG: PIN domain-containing protein [Verrucomicrobiae bacterium]|nr:PIN domain-containing protein [Verrucomicrobiae bacterium]
MIAWLVDTGPLVAFFDRGDAYHLWTKEQWAQAPVPLLTCDAVLAEATYLLEEHAGLAPEKVLTLLERNVLSAPFHLEEHASSVARLLERYRDQGIQLADACLVRMSEVKRDCRVFTLDRKDFGIYRRFERQVIPLVTPDER